MQLDESSITAPLGVLRFGPAWKPRWDFFLATLMVLA
jgi:hypothetical protein